jgi:hypothetical protein
LASLSDAIGQLHEHLKCSLVGILSQHPRHRHALQLSARLHSLHSRCSKTTKATPLPPPPQQQQRVEGGGDAALAVGPLEGDVERSVERCILRAFEMTNEDFLLRRYVLLSVCPQLFAFN